MEGGRYLAVRFCLDANGAVWYGDVGNKRCVRMGEGGEVLQVIDR